MAATVNNKTNSNSSAVTRDTALPAASSHANTTPSSSPSSADVAAAASPPSPPAPAAMVSLSRYSSYAYPGPSARQPNYIVEHAAPAMLCLLRRADPRPYTPLPPELVLRAAHPLDYTLRTSPHISHQAVLDFYRVADGHYGVQREQPPHTLGLRARGAVHHARAAAHGARAPQYNDSYGGSSSSSSGGGGSSSSRAEVQRDVVAVVGGGGGGVGDNRTTVMREHVLSSGSADDDNNNNKHVSVNIGGGSSSLTTTTTAAATASSSTTTTTTATHNVDDAFTRDVERYRLSQIKRNAQHVDAALYTRTCIYYNTKEGCRRGASCEYVHMDRNGHVVPTLRSTTTAVTATTRTSSTTAAATPHHVRDSSSSGGGSSIHTAGGGGGTGL